jgi:hypothetical protein
MESYIVRYILQWKEGMISVSCTRLKFSQGGREGLREGDRPQAHGRLKSMNSLRSNNIDFCAALTV